MQIIELYQFFYNVQKHTPVRGPHPVGKGSTKTGWNTLIKGQKRTVLWVVLENTPGTGLDLSGLSEPKIPIRYLHLQSVA
jgi:hypothetical protein